MSNTSSIVCYAHFHMTPAEYGLWDVARSLSYESGILYFSGRKIAGRFKGLGKTGAYSLAASLTSSGWFHLLKDSVRRKDGLWSPRQYKVLSHAEWIIEHPDCCGSPVPNGDQPVLAEGQDEDSPVPLGDQPVPISDQPVLVEGHNLIEPYLIKPTYKESDNHKPVQTSGLDGFVNRFSKSRQRKAPAAMVSGEPVPNQGQVPGSVSNTEAAHRAATAITNTIGATGGSEQAAWADGIRQLLDGGHSRDEILEVANYAHQTFKPGTVKREGPAEFVASYPRLHEVWKAAGQESQKGKTA
jgi:hypothetical protein